MIKCTQKAPSIIDKTTNTIARHKNGLNMGENVRSSVLLHTRCRSLPGRNHCPNCCYCHCPFRHPCHRRSCHHRSFPSHRCPRRHYNFHHYRSNLRHNHFHSHSSHHFQNRSHNHSRHSHHPYI